jgi:hypothetical protein
MTCPSGGSLHLTNLTEFTAEHVIQPGYDFGDELFVDDQ